MFIPTEHLVKN